MRESESARVARAVRSSVLLLDDIVIAMIDVLSHLVVADCGVVLVVLGGVFEELGVLTQLAIRSVVVQVVGGGSDSSSERHHGEGCLHHFERSR